MCLYADWTAPKPHGTRQAQPHIALIKYRVFWSSRTPQGTLSCSRWQINCSQWGRNWVAFFVSGPDEQKQEILFPCRLNRKTIKPDRTGVQKQAPTRGLGYSWWGGGARQKHRESGEEVNNWDFIYILSICAQTGKRRRKKTVGLHEWAGLGGN